jgi:hypothetical protein
MIQTVGSRWSGIRPAQCFFNRAKRLKQSSKIPEGMAEGDATVPENGGRLR